LQECTTHLDAKGVAHSGIIDLDKAQPWSFATPTTSSSSSTSTQTTLSREAENGSYLSLAMSPSTILLKSAVPKDTYSARFA
jgi:hypothetical protein